MVSAISFLSIMLTLVSPKVAYASSIDTVLAMAANAADPRPVLMIGENHVFSTARDLSLEIAKKVLESGSTITFASEFLDQNDSFEYKLNNFSKMPNSVQFAELLKAFSKNLSGNIPPSDVAKTLLKLISLKVKHKNKLKICSIDERIPYQDLFLEVETDSQKTVAKIRYGKVSAAIQKDLSLEEFYSNVRDPMWATHLSECALEKGLILILAGAAHIETQNSGKSGTKYFPYFWKTLYPSAWIESILVASTDSTVNTEYDFKEYFSKPANLLSNFYKSKELTDRNISDLQMSLFKNYDYIAFINQDFSNKVIYSTSMPYDEDGLVYPLISYINGDQWSKKRVNFEGCNGHVGVGSGSGFYLGRVGSKHYVGTAFHVVENAEKKLPLHCGPFSFGYMGDIAYSSTDLDFALIEVILEDDAETRPYKIEPLFINHSASIALYGYGSYLNDDSHLTVDMSDDCILLEDVGAVKLRSDPDPVSPSSYKTYMVATGCDASHGDSGGLFIEKASGKPIGFITSSHVIKAPVPSSQLLGNSGDSNWIWNNRVGSLMVPFTKVFKQLKTEIRNGSLSEDFLTILGK